MRSSAASSDNLVGASDVCVHTNDSTSGYDRRVE